MYTPVDYTSFFQYQPAPCLLLSAEAGEWVVRDVNKAYLQAMGLRQEEVLGKPVDTLSVYKEAFYSDPQGNVVWKNILAAILQEKKSAELPALSFRISLPGVQVRNWKIVHTLLPAPTAGQAPCVIHTLTEIPLPIPGEHQPPQAPVETGTPPGILRDQVMSNIYRQYTELFNNLPVYICVLKGPDHVIEQANPVFYSFFGKKDILGKPLKAAFPEFIVQEVIEKLDEVYRTGHPYEVSESPLTLISTGGKASRTVYRNVFYRAYHNEEGRVEGVFIFGVDVTESILSRKMVEQSSERYEQVTRATFDAVWDWDIEKDETYYGAGFENIFGYVQDAMYSKKTDWELHVHPHDVQRLLDSVHRKLAAADDTWIDKYRYQRADGEFCFVMDRAVILRDRNGKATRMIGAMRDVTDEAKREEQARMIYRIAGHFNNEPDLETAMDKTIREVLQFTGGVVAECWTMDYSGSSLLLTAQTSLHAELYSRNAVSKLLISEGLPGQVWLNRSIVYIADLATDPHFLRRDFAEKNHLVSGVGVPLFYRNKLLGVLTTYSNKPMRQNQFKLLGQDVLNRLAENMQRKIMETEMNLFFDLTPDLLVVAGTDGYFKKLNPAFIKTLGYSQMELLSMPFLHFVPMENRQIVEEMIGRLSQGETILNVEISLQAKSGSLVQLSWSAIMAFKEQLIIGTAKDITENKKAQLEVLNRNQRITELLESIGDGFYALDRDCKIEYWNNRAEEILEIKKEKVLGKVFWDIFPKEDFSELVKYYEAARNDGKVRHFERYNASLDKWFDISVYTAAHSGISVFFRDVTEKVNYIKAVEEQNEKLQSIAWTQSHKVRAPLSRILGLVGLVRELGPGSPEFPQIIEYLEVSAKELDQVIHEVVEHTGSVQPNAKDEFPNDRHD